MNVQKQPDGWWYVEREYRSRAHRWAQPWLFLAWCLTLGRACKSWPKGDVEVWSPTAPMVLVEVGPEVFRLFREDDPRLQPGGGLHGRPRQHKTIRRGPPTANRGTR